MLTDGREVHSSVLGGHVLTERFLGFFYIRRVVKRTMTAVNWRKRRTQMKERRIQRMRRKRKKCVYRGWTARRR